jgi:hypothetical protein
MRSGLWLFMERAAVAPSPAADADAETGAEPGEGDTGAVLALISRLPLED